MEFRILMPTVRAHSSHKPGLSWFGVDVSFHVAQQPFQVQGFQLYAVEKWIVERTRAVTVLAVYTGDPAHKITVTPLDPSHSLSHSEAQAEWDKALHNLRRDGARPRQTPDGLIFATSLANFRSDFTIIPIPLGNFLDVRDQLYANIGLLRMGCGGRMAVSLAETSETTKDRFISMYHLPDTFAAPPLGSSTSTTPITSPAKHKSPTRLSAYSYHPPEHRSSRNSLDGSKSKGRDSALFNAAVLELVRLVQAGLAIFGMFPAEYWGPAVLTNAGAAGKGAEIDGLLCDLTVDGIQRWISDVGEPLLGVEPMERVADPLFVSALLSLVLSTRNKLAAILNNHANNVPKDPFLHPNAFAKALALYVQCSPNPSSPAPPTAHLTPFHSPHLSLHTPAFLSSNNSPTFSNNSATTVGTISTTTGPGVVLSRALIESINAGYEKTQRTERRVHRVLLNKLDDLTSAVGGDRDRDAGESDARGRAGGGAGLGLSGNDGGGGSGGSQIQILSGIGSLASGLGLGLSGGLPGAEAIVEGVTDLNTFVRSVVGKDGGRDGGRDRRSRRGFDSGEWGEDGERDAVGGSLRALWGGRVADVVRMRERLGGRRVEWEERRRLGSGERERERWASGVVSDGDMEYGERLERTTEDESETVGATLLGRPWSGRVQKKIESWAGLNRIDGKRGKKHHSADLSIVPSSRRGSLSATYTPSVIPISRGASAESESSLPAAGPSVLHHAQPQSPTLPALVFPGDRDNDDEDLLSSGQVSPIDAPNPFNALYGNPPGGVPEIGSTLNLDAPSDYDRKVLSFNQKRPWGSRMYQSRVSSWSDPVSAKEMGGEDEESEESEGSEGVVKGVGLGMGMGKGKKDGRVGKSRLGESILGGGDDAGGVMVDEPQSIDSHAAHKSLFSAHNPRRRRSFHDLESFKAMRVSSVDHLRIDVELCAQLLVMSRRQQHLEGVLACLQILTASLSSKNAHLREGYDAHQPFIADLDARSQVIDQIDNERLRADMTTRETKTLLYESEQFRVPELWHMGSHPRKTVLSLRDKVFGTGGRRLPTGVHGAHGRYNRLQWSLDGQERLVDWMGRTESEVEEESAVEVADVSMPGEEDEEDVVEHPGIKPLWFLRFFTTWGAMWGASAKTGVEGKTKLGGEVKEAKEGTSAKASMETSPERFGPPTVIISPVDSDE